MSPKRKRRLAAALIGLTFSTVVGVPEHRSHVALESRGVVAPVTLSRYGESDFAGTTAHYRFQTQEGQSVNASVETSEPRAYYERLEVVYDPEDPSRYEEKPVYDRYSRTWMLF
ncbi:MAG TPA: hypothetical protein VGB53_03575, partial [Rubricoccaceae bacterium]